MKKAIDVSDVPREVISYASDKILNDYSDVSTRQKNAVGLNVPLDLLIVVAENSKSLSDYRKYAHSIDETIKLADKFKSIGLINELDSGNLIDTKLPDGKVILNNKHLQEMLKFSNNGYVYYISRDKLLNDVNCLIEYLASIVVVYFALRRDTLDNGAYKGNITEFKHALKELVQPITEIRINEFNKNWLVALDVVKDSARLIDFKEVVSLNSQTSFLKKAALLLEKNKFLTYTFFIRELKNDLKSRFSRVFFDYASYTDKLIDDLSLVLTCAVVDKADRFVDLRGINIETLLK